MRSGHLMRSRGYKLVQFGASERITHTHTHTHAHPDFAELDVSLGQHILLTLEQHFNSKM